MSTKQYSVKYTPDFDPTIVNVSQNDVGRQFDIKIIDESGTAQEVPTGSTVTFVGTKPSGLGFTVNCTFNGAIVHVTTTDVMTDEYGLIPAEVRIVDGTKTIGMANVNLRVEKNPHPDGTIDDNIEHIVPTFNAIFQRLTALETDVAALKPDVSDLKSRMTAAETTLGNVAGEVEGQSQSIANIGTELGGIRTGYDGTVYPSAGDAVRAQAMKLDSTLTESGKAADAKVAGDKIAVNTNQIINILKNSPFEHINLEFVAGKIINYAGDVVDFSSTDWLVSNPVDVTNYSALYVKSTTGYESSYVAIYDANMALIKNMPSPGGRITTFNDIILLPANAAYIRISNIRGNESYVKHQAEYVIDDTLTESGAAADAKVAGDKINVNTNQIINILKNSPFESINLEFVAGKIINYAGDVVDFSSTDWLVSNPVDVTNYSALYVKATNGFENCYAAVYDADMSVINKIQSPGGATATFNDIILLPENAAYIRISNIRGNESYIKHQAEYSLKWSEKKWVCLGDSLTEVNSRTTKHYHDYIAEATGITVVNMGDSGSGYMNEQNLGTAFYQRAANVPTDADVYTIFGSGNDLSHPLGSPTDTGTTTICGCINETIDVLIGLIPTIQLGIVAPTPWVGNKPTLDDSNPMALYVKALKEICYIRSIPFLDLYHESNLRPWTEEGRAACYSKDNGGGVHPDEAGHKIIAPRFEGFLDTLLLD